MSRERRVFTEIPISIDALFGREKSQVEISAQDRDKYNLLAIGNFKEDNMKVVESERGLLAPEEEVAKVFVDNYVKNFIDNKNEALAAQGKRAIVDNPKLHVGRVKTSENQCELAIEHGVASYGKLVALGREEGIKSAYELYTKQVQGEHLSFGRFKELFQPVSLSVDGLIFTSDNYILVAKRHPDKVGTYGDAWHVPSGYVDETDRDASGQIDIFKSMQREIEEEVGVKKDQISNLVCIGAAKNPGVATVNMLFIGRTNLKSVDIVDRNAVDAKKRLLLQPKDIDGDIRPRKILSPKNEPTHILPALLKIDQVFGKQKKHGTPGPELAVPTSQALFFLVDKMLK